MKNTQKGFIVPLLITIIVVLAIGGGVYIYTRSTSITQNNNTSASPVATKNVQSNQVYDGQLYSFSYPSTWSVWEANRNLGLTILYPKSEENQVRNKTISTTDEITVAIVDGQPNTTGTQKISLNNQTWFVKNYGARIDGGTENGLGYYKVISSNKFVELTSGVSNKLNIEIVAASFVSKSGMQSATDSNITNNDVNKSIDTCNNMTNITNRSECYVEALKAVKNSSVCERISDDGYKDGYRDLCYLFTAPLEKNPAVCDKIQLASSLPEKNQCYALVAQSTKNPEICDKISDSSKFSECYDIVGPSKWYLSVCEKKQDNQNITENFLIGKQYSELSGPNIVYGTFNSDGTIIVHHLGGGYPAPDPVLKTDKWRIENGNLIIEGEFTGAIKDAKFYNVNGDVFAILGNVRIGSVAENTSTNPPILCP